MEQITKAQYWFLWAALDVYGRINELIGTPDDVGTNFNRPYHDLTPADILTILSELFYNGDIIGIRWSEIDQELEKFLPSNFEIERALNNETDEVLGWELTEQGGLKWEYYSQPDWHLHYDLRSSTEDIWTITSQNKQLVEAVFLDQFEWSDYVPIINSLRWEVLASWKPYHWKTLTQGYRLSYNIHPTTPAQHSSQLGLEQSDLLKRSRHWYKPYLWDRYKSY